MCSVAWMSALARHFAQPKARATSTGCEADRLCSQSDIRKEERGLERTIRDLQRDSKNAAKQVAVAAKRGDMASARTLAKEIVHTKKVRGDGAVVVVLYAVQTWRPGVSQRAAHLQPKAGAQHRLAGCVVSPLMYWFEIILIKAIVTPAIGQGTSDT